MRTQLTLLTHSLSLNLLHEIVSEVHVANEGKSMEKRKGRIDEERS